MQKILQVRAMKHVEELLGIQKELVGMQNQLTQFENANKELNQINEDAKNKVISQILIPSLGGLLIRTNPLSKKFKTLSRDRERQFVNSIIGIKGQMAHRNDLYNETMLKICLYLLFHLDEEGIDLKSQDFAKYFKEEK